MRNPFNFEVSSFDLNTETGKTDYNPQSIRRLQQALNRDPSLQLPADGVMGFRTRRAIRDFQRQKGLSANGIVDQNTVRALIGEYSGQATSQSIYENEADYFELEGEANRKSVGYAKWIQQSLNKIMGLRLAIDGDIGAQTRSAIRSFQQKHGLTADGDVGPMTERALIRAGAGSPTQSRGIKSTSPVVANGQKIDRQKDNGGTTPISPVKPSPVLVWPSFPLPSTETGRFFAALKKLEARIITSGDPRNWRYLCWISKLKSGNVDDRLIKWSTICPATSGAIGAAFTVGPCDITLGMPVKQATIQNGIQSIADVDQNGQAIGIFTYLRPNIIVAEELTAQPLESFRMLHDNVQMAIDKLSLWANNPMGGSSAMPRAYVSIKDWIGRRQRDKNSLYSCM